MADVVSTAQKQAGQKFTECMKSLDVLAMSAKPEGNPFELIYAAAWRSAKEAALEEYYWTSKKSEALYTGTLALLSFLRISAKTEKDEKLLEKQMEEVRVRLNHVVSL